MYNQQFRNGYNMLCYSVASPQVRLSYLQLHQYQNSNSYEYPECLKSQITPLTNAFHTKKVLKMAANSGLHSSSKLHDSETCDYCRSAAKKLMTPPDFEEIYPEAEEFKHDEYSLFAKNLKLFDNPKVQELIEVSNVGFHFAPNKRFSTGLQVNSLEESCLIGSVGDISFDDFLTKDTAAGAYESANAFDDIWNEQEPSLNSPFTPSHSSTFNEKFQRISSKLPAWKEPIVIDPSLSPSYNSVFPSLAPAGRKKFQEKKIVRTGNGVSKKTRK